MPKQEKNICQWGKKKILFSFELLILFNLLENIF